jgi:FkbM family methyltransferase
VFIRGRTTDDTVLESVLADNQYAFDVRLAPRTIIDAGANCGLATAFFQARFPDAEIVALEPEDSNFDMLVRNVGHSATVHPLKGALWSRECCLRIVNPDATKYAFQVREIDDGLDGNDGAIKGYSVPKILAMRGWNTVDLLKLDIEGSEREIFEHGCSGWLHRVSMIVIELHEAYAPGAGRALFRALAPFDYRVFVSGENLVIYLGVH